MRKLKKNLTVLLILLLALPAIGAKNSVSGKTFKKLTEIQEIMGEGNSSEAFLQLNALLADVESDSLDQALTLQTLGYVEMARENFPEAIKHLKASLALNVLPQNVVYNVGYMVAQLHAALGEFDEALVFAESWFQKLEEPKPDQLIFMANIYAQTKQYEKSIPYVERAISVAEKPKETWFQLLTAGYFELERFNEAAKSLQKTIDNWPDKSGYWEQLASVYVLLEDESSALSVLKLAFIQNILEKENTFKSLIQLAVANGVPEHAARLIELCFAENYLPQNKEYLKMLAVALTAAKERDAAILAYKRLANISEEGDPWISISNIYVEKGSWGEAETALKSALQKKLEEPGKAWLLLGISQAELGKFGDAKKSLKKAGAYENTERSASKWIRYAEDMRRQAEWIAQFD